MAVADWAAWVAARADPTQCVCTAKSATTVVAARSYASWLAAPDAGSAPTTAVVPTNATTGALGPQRTTSAASRIAAVATGASGVGGMLVLCDRLSHQGGLSGTTTTAQTTNLPTAALTRYTGGDGVWIALDIYSAVGTTGTTVTATYTNQAGTGSQVTPSASFGATGFNAASRRIILPYQQGDTGARSVESVLLAGTTGTAGNFGVTLLKPLLCVPLLADWDARELDAFLRLASPAALVDGACLEWTLFSASTTTNVVATQLALVEV